MPRRPGDRLVTLTVSAEEHARLRARAEELSRQTGRIVSVASVLRRAVNRMALEETGAPLGLRRRTYGGDREGRR